MLGAVMDFDYASAASRHLHDASLLLAGSRYDSAAYLSGYVAECGLKAVIEVAGQRVPFVHDLAKLGRQYLVLAADLSLATRYYPVDLDPDLDLLADRWTIDLRYVATGTTAGPDACALLLAAEAVYHRTVGRMVLDGFLVRPPL